MHGFLAILLICVLTSPVKANQSFVTKLSQKLDSFDLRIQELETLASKRRRDKFRHKARTLYILQKIMFMRWKLNFEEQLSPADEGKILARGKENNQILATALEEAS